jgi:hypothetical protein
MIFPCPRFMGHPPMRETCKAGFAAKILQASVFSRGLLKSPNPAGCFPPKPPARLLMHSDHRRERPKQQEYRGNKREGLVPRRGVSGRNPQKMRQSVEEPSGKSLSHHPCAEIDSMYAYDCHPLIRFLSLVAAHNQVPDVSLRLAAPTALVAATELECTECSCN